VAGRKANENETGSGSLRPEFPAEIEAAIITAGLQEPYVKAAVEKSAHFGQSRSVTAGTNHSR
jgi:hypothetical protein